MDTNSIRGLDIRVNFATAKINFGICANEKNEENILEVIFSAEKLGYCDFLLKVENPPLMFIDEYVLVDAWKEGQKEARHHDQVENCPVCQHPNSIFCSAHD